MTAKMRYWVYKHDADDDITDDLGDFEELEEAIDAAVDQGLSEDGYEKTVRVVDRQAGSQTVWMAGPVVRAETTT